MKSKSVFLLIFVLMVSLLLPASVLAQDGTNPDGTVDASAVTLPAPPAIWTTRIAYANPGPAATDMAVTYITKDGAQFFHPSLIHVPAHGSGVVLAGSIGGNASAAMLSSAGPIQAVYEQYSAAYDPRYGSPLYTTFNAGQASGTVYIPYFAYQFTEMAGTKALVFSSDVGVQNITDNPVSITVSSPAGDLLTKDVPAKAAFHFTGAELSLAPNYRGPLVVKGPDNSLVAASVVQEQGGRRAFSFEGLAPSQAAQSFHLPRMSCSTTAALPTSVFYVQNTSPDTATTINAMFYSGLTGKVILPKISTNFSGLALPAGQMLAIDPCVDPNLSSKSGSVQIDSTGTPIVVVAMIKNKYGVGTAFIGQSLPAATATYTYVLPYVTWGTSTSKPRTMLNLLNLGAANATIKLDYYLFDGTLKKSRIITIKPNVIASQSPSTAGVLIKGKYDGMVIVTTNLPLSVVVTISRSVSGVSGTTSLAEDYDATLYPGP